MYSGISNNKLPIIVNGKEPDPKLVEEMYHVKQAQENNQWIWL